MEDWQRTHDWGALTRDEIRQARDAGAFPVLTVASCEQHGDHLPVDTDAVSAYRVAMAAAERCTEAFALVLPPPGFGFSPHHAAWPGTITLSLPTFLAMVTDVAESVMRTGFDRLLVVNGHGGNQAPLGALCSDLGSRGLRVAAVNYFSPGQADWTDHVPGAKKTVAHACAYETSMQLALRPGERQRILGRVAGLPTRMTPPYVESGANPLRRHRRVLCHAVPGRRPRLLRRPGRLHGRSRRDPAGQDRRRPRPLLRRFRHRPPQSRPILNAKSPLPPGEGLGEGGRPPP